MNESITSSLGVPAATSRDFLTEVLRDGAQPRELPRGRFALWHGQPKASCTIEHISP